MAIKVFLNGFWRWLRFGGGLKNNLDFARNPDKQQGSAFLGWTGRLSLFQKLRMSVQAINGSRSVQLTPMSYIFAAGLGGFIGLLLVLATKNKYWLWLAPIAVVAAYFASLLSISKRFNAKKDLQILLVEIWRPEAAARLRKTEQIAMLQDTDLPLLKLGTWQHPILHGHSWDDSGLTSLTFQDAATAKLIESDIADAKLETAPNYHDLETSITVSKIHRSDETNLDHSHHSKVLSHTAVEEVMRFQPQNVDAAPEDFEQIWHRLSDRLSWQKVRSGRVKLDGGVVENVFVYRVDQAAVYEVIAGNTEIVISFAKNPRKNIQLLTVPLSELAHYGEN